MAFNVNDYVVVGKNDMWETHITRGDINKRNPEFISSWIPNGGGGNMKLNLGCGRNIRAGYVNLDKVELDGVDVVHDLNTFPYPFDDNRFDEIYCSHVLEHVNDLVKVVEELHRITKLYGRIKVIAPYFASQGAFNDPTHNIFFTYRTFKFFSSDGYYTNAVLDVIKQRMFFFSSKKFMESKWYSAVLDYVLNLFPMLYQRYLCWILPAAEIHYLLEVEKRRNK